MQIIRKKAIRAALNLPQYTSVAYIHRKSNLPQIKPYAESLLTGAISTARFNHDHQLLTLLQEIQHDILWRTEIMDDTRVIKHSSHLCDRVCSLGTSTCKHAARDGFSTSK